MIGFDYDKAEIEYEAGPLRHREEVLWRGDPVFVIPDLPARRNGGIRDLY